MIDRLVMDMDGLVKFGIFIFLYRVLIDFFFDFYVFCMRIVKEIIKKIVVYFVYFMYK